MVASSDYILARTHIFEELYLLYDSNLNLLLLSTHLNLFLDDLYDYFSNYQLRLERVSKLNNQDYTIDYYP